MPTPYCREVSHVDDGIGSDEETRRRRHVCDAIVLLTTRKRNDRVLRLAYQRWDAIQAKPAGARSPAEIHFINQLLQFERLYGLLRGNANSDAVRTVELSIKRLDQNCDVPCEVQALREDARASATDMHTSFLAKQSRAMRRVANDGGPTLAGKHKDDDDEPSEVEPPTTPACEGTLAAPMPLRRSVLSDTNLANLCLANAGGIVHKDSSGVQLRAVPPRKRRAAALTR